MNQFVTMHMFRRVYTYMYIGFIRFTRVDYMIYDLLTKVAILHKYVGC